MQKQNRLYFLDNIRSLAMLMVFLFHCARFFDAEDWHVKNPQTSLVATSFVALLVLWIMPLFFFISGASTWFALQKKGNGQFVKDRIKRILVPLVFGALIWAMPQVYLERVSHGNYTGSLISFVPHYFDGMYGFGGNFAWMGLHLWYLLLLFVFSLLLLPVFGWIKSTQNGRLQKMLQHPALLGLFALATMIPGWLLPPEQIVGMRVWGGWNMIEHALFLMFGYLAFSQTAFWANCHRYRVLFLLSALVASLLILYWLVLQQQAQFGSIFFYTKIAVRNIACWGWIGSILGFGYHHLNKTGKRWQYAAETVLPFYVLHQTIIIIIGYFVAQWSIHSGAKYAIIAASSFAVIMLLYSALVKRTAFTRWLFGMPPGSAKKRADLSAKNRQSSTTLLTD